MSTAIGPAIISIGAPEEQWQRDLAIVRAMRPSLLKVPIETAFSPFPSRIRALADEFRPSLMIMSLGMEAVDEGWPRAKLLIGQQLDTVKAHPETEFVIELGNEGEYHDPPWGKAKDQWGYRYQVLQLAKQIRAEWPLPNLKIGCSMPVFLDAARDVVLSRDQWGCVADDLDYLCTHYYGHEYIGDNAGNGRDFNAAWGPIYAMLKETAKPILFTEIGINAPSSDMPTKARRLLDWLNQQPEQTVGAAVWCVGEWANMGLDLSGAAVYGARGRQEAPASPPTPPTKEQSMPELWYPKAERGTSPWCNNGPANGRQWPKNVTMVVDHHTAATWQGTINTFGPASGRKVSAHFLVGRDGRVHQFVSLADIAWHAGEWNANLHSVGIEHEHYQRPDGSWTEWTDAQLNASAELHSWLRSQMPAFSMHRHSEFTSTGCPDSLPIDEIKARMDRASYQAAQPDVFTAPTGKTISGGFLAFWRSLDENQVNLRLLGYPLTQEFQSRVDGWPQEFTVQVFERGTLIWRGGEQPPWDVAAVNAQEDAAVRADAKDRGLLT